MTVGELIELLKVYPSEAAVYVDDDGRECDPEPSRHLVRDFVTQEIKVKVTL